MSRADDLYFTSLLEQILALGDLPLTLDTKKVTPLNSRAREISGRPNIIQMKDLSYGFDFWLREHKNLMFIAIKNGTWVLMAAGFPGHLHFPPPKESVVLPNPIGKSLICMALAGGLKENTNETLSQVQLHASGAYAIFHGVDSLEYHGSTGRTRSMKIPVHIAGAQSIYVEGIQLESDGLLAYRNSANQIVFSPMETKESLQDIYWKQIFLPYWDWKSRHPTAKVIITVQMTVSDGYYLYGVEFENFSPASMVIKKSLRVSFEPSSLTNTGACDVTIAS